MPSYRLNLAYDGTDFYGSQVQPNRRTVQGELERVLGELLGEPTRTTLAGRTDRGVHALGQVAAIHVPGWRAPASELKRALDARLARDLAATDVVACEATFHPRFDAVWREYRYRVAPGIVSPFVGRYAWTLRKDVDARAMESAARALVGTHDFASFAGGGEGVPWSDRARLPRGSRRTVLRCACRETAISDGPGCGRSVRAVEIVVTADGFLPQMVRNIAGGLVEVGQGRRSPAWIEELLDRRDRRFGSPAAPARGLALVRIGYGNESWNEADFDAP